MSDALVHMDAEIEAHIPTRPPGSELTWRSVTAAAIVAALMGASYPYMVLKLGFGPNVSVVSAFFGFLILNLMGRGRYDRWQNNIVQTAGTSAAQTAFMCGLLAAFEMLRASKVVSFTLDPSPFQIFVWLTVGSLLGVLLAVPMRRHFIIDEKLTYADGVAAGETLIVLDPPRGDAAGDNDARAHALRAARILGIGLVASALLMLFREDAKIFHFIPEGWDPGALTLGVAGAAFVVANMGVGVSYSLLNFGSGMIVGLRINSWMLLGCIIGWIVLPYYLVTHGGLPDHPSRTQVLYWIMWPGVGMIIAGGLAALALRWKVLIASFTSLRNAKFSSDELPMKWVIGGVIVLVPALCLVQYFVLGMPIWMTLTALVLVVPMMLVGLRVLGETNWGPISPLSNLMQGLFAAIAPGNVVANIVANGTTGTVASTSEGLMQDYKTGHMIGSTPRAMTIAQLMGAPIGAAMLAIVYPALSRTYGVVGDHAGLTAPGGRRMAGFAELLSGGIGTLPKSALIAMVVFAVLGVIFAVLEDQPKLKRWTPSPTALGLGMLLPFSAVATMFLGGAVGAAWQARSRGSSDRYAIPLASGFIAGEALIAVIVPVLIWLGLGYK